MEKQDILSINHFYVDFCLYLLYTEIRFFLRNGGRHMKKIALKALTTVSAMALLAGASVVAANTDSQAKKVSVKKVKATTEAGKTAYVAKGNSGYGSDQK